MNKNKAFLISLIATSGVAIGFSALSYKKHKEQKKIASYQKKKKKNKTIPLRRTKFIRDLATKRVNLVLSALQKRNPNEQEYLQYVSVVTRSLTPLLMKDLKYVEALERLIEPERVFTFRVAWADDNGIKHINRGYRVQFSSSIGPYKGGIRFDPKMNLSIMKSLAFEQTMKNSLTALPMGGAMGGADFDPKGKSDNEVKNFCHAFIAELYKIIGPNCDIPGPDINVGTREIGYMYGMYRKLTSQTNGTLTGKRYNWGGSRVRTEATGYGLVYFLEYMLHDNNIPLEGRRITISGSGPVAQFAVEKLIERGAIPLTMSDSDGFIYARNGITLEMLKKIMYLKNVERGRLEELSKIVEYHGDKQRPWVVPCEIALPCAYHNEIRRKDALNLIQNGCIAVAEGSNISSAPNALKLFKQHNLLYAPGKAANAGGVAISGLEMSQNSIKLKMDPQDIKMGLKGIIYNIFEACRTAAQQFGDNDFDYSSGANIAAFLKLANCLFDEGII
ncbi:nadp-specific glutamate dehydrogenase 1-related [Anaeramoeba flamelloides]|uniref:glutamate dehydrogenase (NADP(+)) n=1 Tax=Anaeramoeba flamelloides TaxID=1746091 RepID=A0AAV7YSE8_9EUKA|nr:nadp-specific glutamate dehydrogenase 1-related [Anaeramoeba flamelloides]